MRFSFKSKTGGWYKESYRHSLAARGIKSNLASKRNFAESIMRPQGVSPTDFKGTDFKGIGQTSNDDILSKGSVRDDARLKEFRPVRKKKEEGPRLLPGGPAFERRERRIAGAEAAAREPFTELTSQLRFGTVTASDLKSQLDMIMLDPTTGKVLPIDSYRQSQLASAAFDGARNMVNQGLAPDWQMLQQAGLSKFQIDELGTALAQKVGSVRAAQMGGPAGAAVVRGAAAGTAGAVGEIAGEAVSGIEGAAEAGFKGTLAKGLKRFEEAPEEGLFSDLSGGAGSVFSPVNVGQPKVRVDMSTGEEIVDQPGWLNPLRVGGLDDELKRRDKSNKAKVERARASEKVDYFVDDIFNGKADLAKVDFSPFKTGLKAYERGDREGLMKSILDLEYENYSLKHRVSLIDNIRQQISSTKNITDTMMKGKEQQGGFFFNPVMGSNTGSAAYAKQTERMSKTMLEVQKSSNAVAQRIAELKRKLNRLSQLGPLDMSEPKQPVKVFSEPAPSWINTLEEGQGIFKYNSPLRGKTNVVLHDLSEVEQKNEVEEM